MLKAYWEAVCDGGCGYKALAEADSLPTRQTALDVLASDGWTQRLDEVWCSVCTPFTEKYIEETTE